MSIQGNLDPHLLLADSDTVCAAADRILAAVGDRPGHIFNLGHGIIKETDPQQVMDLIAHVHRVSQRTVKYAMALAPSIRFTRLCSATIPPIFRLIAI